jgi:hypothetical protein
MSRVEGENPDDEANAQANTTSYNDYDNRDDRYNDGNEDEDEDEANTDEVTCRLAPSRVSLCKNTRKSIYLTLRLHNPILTFT